ncbi:MAG: hypothetical protein ACK56I_03080, partial [bacterium]
VRIVFREHPYACDYVTRFIIFIPKKGDHHPTAPDGNKMPQRRTNVADNATPIYLLCRKADQPLFRGSYDRHVLERRSRRRGRLKVWLASYPAPPRRGFAWLRFGGRFTLASLIADEGGRDSWKTFAHSLGASDHAITPKAQRVTSHYLDAYVTQGTSG